jgi:hypothetical protein
LKNQNEVEFDRDIHNNIKHALTLNINSSTCKNSIVNTSGCKYWKINFDPDDKDDRFMFLTQSSKEQYIDVSDGTEMENKKEIAFLFFYTIGPTLYSVTCLPPLSV